MGGTQIRMGAERLGSFADVVVVSINYRLDMIGFLCLDSDQAAGNMGMLDMVVALEWVQKYIGYFGGDKTKVTVFGESAGSASIGHLLLSESTNGLFSKAIGQSGSAVSSWAFDKRPEFHARNMAEIMGCNELAPDDLVACLKTKTIDEITNVTGQYVKDQRAEGNLGFGGNIPCAQSRGERKFYTQYQTPEELLTSGNYEHVPIMFGANRDEGSFIYAIVYNRFMVPNNLTEDTYWLSYEFVPQLLKTVRMENSYGIEELLERAYFDEWQIGDLRAMQDGLIDLLGTFFLKASSYEMVEENSRYIDSFWYSFDYASEFKSMFHVLNLNPAKKANVTEPGVCHADELLYLFDAELPMVLCDSGLISADAVSCVQDTGNPITDINNAIACLTDQAISNFQIYLEFLTLLFLFLIS